MCGIFQKLIQITSHNRHENPFVCLPFCYIYSVVIFFCFLRQRNWADEHGNICKTRQHLNELICSRWKYNIKFEINGMVQMSTSSERILQRIDPKLGMIIWILINGLRFLWFNFLLVVFSFLSCKNFQPTFLISHNLISLVREFSVLRYDRNKYYGTLKS